jgi:predicted NBD/HSP70 family sugar kinase
MKQPINIVSGAKFSPAAMLEQLRTRLSAGAFDVVTIGVPAPVIHGHVVHEPHNLGKGWVGFDFQAALGCPVRLINDAAMQALGSHVSGHMLFLGLGTGLGSAMIADGVIEPLELAHLPYRRYTFEHYVGEDALERLGRQKWQTNVYAVVKVLRAALQPDSVVLGGGNVRHLHKLPSGVTRGDNDNAFVGGFRLWNDVR